MSVALILSVRITCLVFERIIEKEWRHIDRDRCRYRDWDARLHFPSISSVYDSLFWSDCFEIDSVCGPARPPLPLSLISKTPPKGGKTQLIVNLSLCFWTSLKHFFSLFYRYTKLLSACFFVFFYFFNLPLCVFFLLTSLCGSLLFFPSPFSLFLFPFFLFWSSIAGILYFLCLFMRLTQWRRYRLCPTVSAIQQPACSLK